MVRLCVAGAVALALVVTASAAAAQPTSYAGLLTGHLGVAASGDVQDASLAPGVSMAVVDRSGLGVEVDASRVGGFDDARFTDSSIATFMVSVVALYPHEQIRPYVVAGGGVVRIRAALPSSQTSVRQTDTAWNAGGGVLYMLNEALGLRADVRYFRQFGRQDALPLGGNGLLTFVRSSFGVTYSWPMR